MNADLPRTYPQLCRFHRACKHAHHIRKGLHPRPLLYTTTEFDDNVDNLVYNFIFKLLAVAWSKFLPDISKAQEIAAEQWEMVCVSNKFLLSYSFR